MKQTCQDTKRALFSKGTAPGPQRQVFVPGVALSRAAQPNQTSVAVGTGNRAPFHPPPGLPVDGKPGQGRQGLDKVTLFTMFVVYYSHESPEKYRLGPFAVVTKSDEPGPFSTASQCRVQFSSHSQSLIPGPPLLIRTRAIPNYVKATTCGKTS
jgi:hypothetical protein